MARYLDDHNTPIDYERRRNLDYRHLLPHEQWLDIRRRLKITTGAERQWRIARCVLFQRISCLPMEADTPIAPGDTHFRVELGSFPARQTPEIADELKDVARRFLAGHGIDDEPISWQPPLELLEGLDLPGNDPQEVDIKRLHQLIRSGRTSLERAATTLGSTYDVVRHVLEEHPAPHTRIAAPSRHAARQDLPAEEFSRLYQHERLSLDQISKLTRFSRGTLTALAAEYGVALRPAGGKPRHEMVDRDWLFEQYVLHRRPLPDLAREKGMSNANMRRWAHVHQIPMRPSGGASHNAALRTTEMAADAPDILKPLLTSTYARQRLSRFAESVEYGSLREAARHLGIHESTLSHQIQLLEQALGEPLLERAKDGNPMKPTELGMTIAVAVRESFLGE